MAHIFKRGQSALLEVIFLEKGQPAIPIDPETHPSFAIRDPDNSIIASGVAHAAQHGKWQHAWFIPEDAMLGEWVVTWHMRSITQKDFTQTIAIVVERSGEPADRVQDRAAFLGFPGEEIEVSFITRGGGTEAKLQVLQSGFSEFASYSNSAFRQQTSGTDVFWSVPVSISTYGSFWLRFTYRPANDLGIISQLKTLAIPPALFWELLYSVQDLLDLIQKDANSTFGYTESEMLRYLEQGVAYLNSMFPVTDWTLYTYPPPLSSLLVEAAAVWAWRGRQAGAVETQFSYSGQEITLDVDRSSGYSDLANTLDQGIRDRISQVKEDFLNNCAPPAHLGLVLGQGRSGYTSRSSRGANTIELAQRGFHAVRSVSVRRRR